MGRGKGKGSGRTEKVREESGQKAFLSLCLPPSLPPSLSPLLGFADYLAAWPCGGQLIIFYRRLLPHNPSVHGTWLTSKLFFSTCGVCWSLHGGRDCCQLPFSIALFRREKGHGSAAFYILQLGPYKCTLCSPEDNLSPALPILQKLPVFPTKIKMNTSFIRPKL